MYDNYGREAAAWLPTLRVTGMRNPVVGVVSEADGEVLGHTPAEVEVLPGAVVLLGAPAEYL